MSSDMDYLIGGMAGAGATILTNPMDVVKTRMQLQGELKARSDHAAKYRGVFHAMYVIAKNDGVLALQKGLAPAMVLGFCLNSVRLGTYRYADVRGWTRNDANDVVFHKAMFWAGLSGFLSGVSANPASVIKTRIQSQAHPSIAVGKQHQYESFWHGCKTLYQKEGVKGYFTGVKATCVRIGMGSCAQLTTFSKFKEYLYKRGYGDSPVLVACVASCLCNFAVVLVEAPLDLVNTRLLNQGPASEGNLMYTGLVDCFSKIYKKEGIHGLYKGLGPLYLRLAPHTTLSLVIWDVVGGIFDKQRKKS